MRRIQTSGIPALERKRLAQVAARIISAGHMLSGYCNQAAITWARTKSDSRLISGYLLHRKHRIVTSLDTHLIHILAKQLTIINDKSTVAGFVPAMLNTRVMMSLSMLVLLNAEEMVNPPMRSMMVGEKMVENTNLRHGC